MKLYAIRDWDKHYENNRTREIKRLEWVPVPNKHDGDGFRTLLAHPEGLQTFAVFILLLEVASKCQPRGILVRDNGQPHTPVTLHRILGVPEAIIGSALDTLADSEIGWLEATDPDIAFVVPTASAKKGAHGRVKRTLQNGHPLTTPLGPVTSRPTVCQWCGQTPPPDGRGGTGILAHHPVGYGNQAADLTVIFVCRKCHVLFEFGHLTIGDILQKFGSQWIKPGLSLDTKKLAPNCGTLAPILPRGTSPASHPVAPQVRTPAPLSVSERITREKELARIEDNLKTAFNHPPDPSAWENRATGEKKLADWKASRQRLRDRKTELLNLLGMAV